MDPLSAILMVIVIMTSDEYETRIDTMTTAKVCETEVECRRLHLACNQLGHEAVERIYRNTGEDKGQYLCQRLDLLRANN